MSCCWEPSQHIGEVAERINPVPFATGGHAEQHRRRTATVVAAHKKPVFPANGLCPQRTFREIVVNTQVAIFHVAAQRLPVAQRI